MNLEQRYRHAEGLSLDTQRKLTMLNTFLSDGDYPILPMEPERPHWNRHVAFWSTAAAVALGLYLLAAAVGVI